MRVVATARTTVAATMATTAHSGKWAGAVAEVGGGGGGTGGPGDGRLAEAAGARPIAAVSDTARPASAVSARRVRGMPRPARRCCDDAGRWVIGVAPSVMLRTSGTACSVVRTIRAARGGRKCLGTGLGRRLGVAVGRS